MPPKPLRHSSAASDDGGGSDWLNASMSKLETPITRWYWSTVGGTLVEGFPLTRQSPTSAGRWVDGLILPDGPHGKLRPQKRVGLARSANTTV